MEISALFLLLCLFLSQFHSMVGARSKSLLPSTNSIYDALEAHALPPGLFPKGISDFSLDPVSGDFELHLVTPAPCHAKFETNVRYETNITGWLGYGKIANLSGVDAQELFLWLPVKGITVDIPSSGLIYFDTGVVLKQFSLSFFETPKDCALVADNTVEGTDVAIDGGPRIVENLSGRSSRKYYGWNTLRAVS